MGKPIAKQGDQIVGLDIHTVLVSSPGGPVPTNLPNPFVGPITLDVSTTVFIEHKGVATVGSGAVNTPPHLPIGGPFQAPPSNKGTVSSGSNTIYVNHKGVARSGDSAKCCNDPTDKDSGHVIAAGKVTAD